MKKIENLVCSIATPCHNVRPSMVDFYTSTSFIVSFFCLINTYNVTNDDQVTLTKMRAAMKEQRRSNQTLKMNVLMLWERLCEDLLMEDEVLDPQPLLNEI